MTSAEAEDDFRCSGEILGRGSTGHVYKVADKYGKPFARKETISSNRGRGVLGQLWVDIMKQGLEPLKHDNVIEFVGAWERTVQETSSPVVVNLYMEFAGHGSVKSLYRDLKNQGKCLSEPKIKGFASDSAKGLHYLHGKGLVHGNLKCSNILLVGDGEKQIAKISDLAPAAIRSAAKAGRTVPDELRKLPFSANLEDRSFWTPPEFLKESTYTKAADVYSFGVTLIEMYTSKHPLPDLDEHQALGEIKKGVLPSLPPNSDTFYAGDCARDLIQLCVHPDPEERPTMEVILDHPFITGRLKGAFFGNEEKVPDFLCRVNDGADAVE